MTTKTAKPRPKGRRWTHEMMVVGLRYRGWTRDGRRALSDRITRRGAITGIRLVREPENPKDENAIMVMLPKSIMDGKQLGYITAAAAELLTPKIDNGTLEVVSAKLEELDWQDDWNTGTLEVKFRDIPTKKPRNKAKKKAT